MLIRWKSYTELVLKGYATFHGVLLIDDYNTDVRDLTTRYTVQQTFKTQQLKSEYIFLHLAPKGEDTLTRILVAGSDISHCLSRIYAVFNWTA